MDRWRFTFIVIIALSMFVYVGSVKKRRRHRNSKNDLTVICGTGRTVVPKRCSNFKSSTQCSELKRCINERVTFNSSAIDRVYTQPVERPPNKSREGDTVDFKCRIFNAEDIEYTVSWHRNGEILFSQEVLIPTMSKNDTTRYRVWTENNTYALKIFDVERDADHGLYACKFNVDGTRGIEETFLVNILHPPEIERITIDGLTSYPQLHHPDPSVLTFLYNETDDASLRCIANSNPDPTINWTKESIPLQNKRIEMIGDLLVITNLSRKDNGRYRCHAYNDQGKASSGFINVQVQYPPVMIIPKPHETGDRDKLVQLECFVQAEPPASKQWLKDGVLVEVDRTQDRIHITTDANSTRLYISHVDPLIDYANYTCRAENLLGAAEGSIDLNGLPTAPEIFSKNISTRMSSYLLKWSYKHTDEDSKVYFTYCYLRRQIYQLSKPKIVVGNPNAPCFNVTVPKHAKERIFTSTLTDLHADADYLLELYAVNQYGRGDITKHTFKTAEVDIESTPSTCTVDSPDTDARVGGNVAVTASLMATHLSATMVFMYLIYFND